MKMKLNKPGIFSSMFNSICALSQINWNILPLYAGSRREQSQSLACSRQRASIRCVEGICQTLSYNHHQRRLWFNWGQHWLSQLYRWGWTHWESKLFQQGRVFNRLFRWFFYHLSKVCHNNFQKGASSKKLPFASILRCFFLLILTLYRWFSII